MVNPLFMLGILVVENIILLLVLAVFFIMKFSWNIDVAILRFVGDKRRPTLIIKKARKRRVGATVSLFVRGYKQPVKDFRAEYFYPSAKGQFGGLVLFEFKTGWLTPCVPEYRKLSPEMKAIVKEFREKMNGAGVVNFEFDEEMYKTLSVKAIDDVDAEWNLRQQQRIDAQYAGGWRDFLYKYAGHIAIVLIALILLIGFIIYLKEVPSMTGQCMQAGVEAAKNTYLSEIAGKFAGGAASVPPG